MMAGIAVPKTNSTDDTAESISKRGSAMASVSRTNPSSALVNIYIKKAANTETATASVGARIFLLSRHTATPSAKKSAIAINKAMPPPIELSINS